MKPAANAETAEEGSLCDIGACLAGIRALTEHNGGIDEEDKRAVYSLACIALAEWRALDKAEGERVGGGR